MNTTQQNTGDDDHLDTAVDRAERGTSAWEDAVRLQRWATPEHGSFYGLAGEIVATLHAIDELAALLHRQVTCYRRDQQEAGEVVYDDTREMDPAERLHVAAIALDEVRGMAAAAEFWANAFWSAISHIGVETLPHGKDAGGAR